MPADTVTGAKQLERWVRGLTGDGEVVAGINEAGTEDEHTGIPRIGVRDGRSGRERQQSQQGGHCAFEDCHCVSPDSGAGAAIHRDCRPAQTA